MLKELLRVVARRRAPRNQIGQRPSTPLSKHIGDEINAITGLFGHPSDLIVRQFLVGGRPNWKIAVVLLQGIVDEVAVNDTILKPLVLWARPTLIDMQKRDIMHQMKTRIITAQDVIEVRTREEAISHILAGQSVILVEGQEVALVVRTKSVPSRGIEQATSEQTVRGPRVGFTELIRDNLALLRLHMKTPDLAVEDLRVGRKSQTDVRLIYLRSIVHPEIIQEVRRRVKSIDTDVVLDSGMIQNLVRDHPYSIFSTIRATERPDSTIADINEGRVALLVDGSPFALTMPNHFYSFFASPEDHYVGFPVTSTLRIFRVLGFFLSVMITPLYIAATSFHQELIPLPLLLNIAATHAAVPFPVVVDALIAEVIVEILREAGVRLPQQFGPAVSIVGALVLGQAAVQAAFIAPGLVIVITAATIASFSVPRAEAAISFRLLRFPLLLVASILGLYGIALGLLVVLYHVSSMKSLGMPFMALYTPGRVSEIGENLVIVPAQVARPVRPSAHRDRLRRGTPPEIREPREDGDTGEE
ncbi:MAG: spore germination protein [Bacillota bacterium]